MHAPLDDKFQIESELARGGMSRVYRARTLADDTEVALKVMALGSDGGDLRGFAKRFDHEASAVMRLDHPNIVKVYATGQTDEFVYIAMQLVTGGTFRNRLGRMLPVAEACAMAIQMARALHHAHMHDIIHRDVKPANMLIDERDPSHLLLADFGIAKIIGQKGVTKTGTAVGTPEYMAPEQAKGGDIDPRADIYGLACVLFEALAGRAPFVGPTALSICYQHVHTRPAYIRGFNHEVPRTLALVIEQALAKNPADRFPDAEAFAVALHPFTEPTGPVVRRASRPLTTPLADLPMRGTPGELPLEILTPPPFVLPPASAGPIPALNTPPSVAPAIDLSDRVARAAAPALATPDDATTRQTQEITPLATPLPNRPRHTQPSMTLKSRDTGKLRESIGPLPGAPADDFAGLSTVQTPASAPTPARSATRRLSASASHSLSRLFFNPPARRVLTLVGIAVAATLVALLVISHGALSGGDSPGATATTPPATVAPTQTALANDTPTVPVATATPGGINPAAALAFSGITLTTAQDDTCTLQTGKTAFAFGQTIYVNTCVAQGYGPGTITFVINDPNGANVATYNLAVTANAASEQSYNYHFVVGRGLEPPGTYTLEIRWNGQKAKVLAFNVQ